MATTLTTGATPVDLRDAHYHPVRATATWAAFVGAMQDLATNTAEERKARDEQRVRETTYARGTTGGY